MLHALQCEAPVTVHGLRIRHNSFNQSHAAQGLPSSLDDLMIERLCGQAIPEQSPDAIGTTMYGQAICKIPTGRTQQTAQNAHTANVAVQVWNAADNKRLCQTNAQIACQHADLACRGCHFLAAAWSYKWAVVCLTE